MAFLLEWIPAACQAGKGRKFLRGGCIGGFPSRKTPQFLRGRCIGGFPGRKMPQFLRGGCPGGIWGRKRYHFLRGTGYRSPAGQENAPIPARKVQFFNKNLVKCRIITTFARSNVWRFQFLNVFETINNV